GPGGRLQPEWAGGLIPHRPVRGQPDPQTPHTGWRGRGPMSIPRFDYVIVGAGIGGLVTAALLAHRGYRVCVLERHYAPGGYGHSFRRGRYTFCAQLHYLWSCGPGEEFDAVLSRLGLSDEVRFTELDPDRFDRLHFPSLSYDICRGFDRNTERIAARF